MSDIVPYQTQTFQNPSPYSSTEPLCFTKNFCIPPEMIEKTSTMLEGVQKIVRPLFQSIAEPLKGLAFRHSSGLWAAAGGVLFGSGLNHCAKTGASGAYTITSLAFSGVLLATAYQQENENTSFLPYFFLGATLGMTFREIKNLNTELANLRRNKTQDETLRKVDQTVRFDVPGEGKVVESADTKTLRNLRTQTKSKKGRLPDAFAEMDVEPGAKGKAEESLDIAEQKGCCRRWCRK